MQRDRLDVHAYHFHPPPLHHYCCCILLMMGLCNTLGNNLAYLSLVSYSLYKKIDEQIYYIINSRYKYTYARKLKHINVPAVLCLVT